MHAKRPLTLLLGAAGASVSASAGYLYMGEDAPPQLQEATVASAKRIPSSPRRSKQPQDPSKLKSLKRSQSSPANRSVKALSKQELGLDQSLARDFACWISSASVYAARQAFYASSHSQHSKSSPLLQQNVLLPEQDASSLSSNSKSSKNNVYHNLFGWLQELTPSEDWDPNRVIQSSSFAMLLNLISGGNQLALREDLEQELYRAVGVLATNAQCAKEIAERTTRYGKQALLNLAQSHEDDSRVGDALHRLVVLDGPDCRFGPANLVSLVSLAVADVPDEYLEFALWALSKAASPHSVAPKYEWRKTLFGDDATAKTRRKLITNEKLWTALLDICDQRSETVQLQAARLLNELSDDPLIGRTMLRHDRSTQVLMQWMTSTSVPLVCTSLDIVAKVAQGDETIRAKLLEMGALDVIRMRLLGNKDCRMTASLLHAVRCVAEPPTSHEGSSSTEAFALDRDALSFVNDSDEEHPLYHDDFVNPTSVTKRQYVDGWIELFTAFLKSDDQHVRDEAAKCLKQISDKGVHTDQAKQEWLISILDAVLQQVPLEIARASASVREAKSRTRPIAGYATESAKYEAAHAKALRALAFVLGRKECQQDLVRLGGIPLLKILMRSENPLVQRETARVLANLFTCNDMHEGVLAFVLHDEQLTRVLEKWTHASDIKLQSIAHRARSNRRYQSSGRDNGSPKRYAEPAAATEDVKYLDGVHPLHFSSTKDEFSSSSSNSSWSDKSSEYDVDVVFIHGLLGCPYETWMCGEDETTVWAQEWLLKDLQREGKNPRVLSIGYDSQLRSSESVWRTMCFQGTSEEIMKKLDAARVGSGERPVIFVTHSLGGVLLKQVLHDAARSEKTRKLVDSVNGVMFYGVPHHGSPVAQTIQAFRPKSLGIDQHPVTEHLHGTPHLEMLNDWCATLFDEKGIAALSVGETAPCRLPVIGFEALVVPPSSANPGFGEFVNVSDATHMSVCKPSSQEDIRYTLAQEFISKHACKPSSVASLDAE